MGFWKGFLGGGWRERLMVLMGDLDGGCICKSNFVSVFIGCGMIFDDLEIERIGVRLKK